MLPTFDSTHCVYVRVGHYLQIRGEYEDEDSTDWYRHWGVQSVEDSLYNTPSYLRVNFASDECKIAFMLAHSGDFSIPSEPACLPYWHTDLEHGFVPMSLRYQATKV